MTLLDINAAKIKAEQESVQLREVIQKKDSEIQGIAGDLLKVRKQNETLETLVADLQRRLQEKDRELQAMDANMFVGYCDTAGRKKMKREVDLLRRIGGKAIPVQEDAKSFKADEPKEAVSVSPGTGAGDEEFWNAPQDRKSEPQSEAVELSTLRGKKEVDLNLWINAPDKKPGEPARRPAVTKPARNPKMDASRKGQVPPRKK